jgi:uncharacterized membrane protein (UPF0182 family)
MNRSHWLKAIAAIAIIGLIIDFGSRIIVDWLWFLEVNYLAVFLKIRLTQVILGILVFGISGLFFWVNLALAGRQKWQWSYNKGWIQDSLPYLPEKSPQLIKNYSPTKVLVNQIKAEQSIRNRPAFRLSFLLPATLVSILILSFLLIYYSDLVIEVWQQKDGLNITFNGLKNVFSQERSQILNRYWWLFGLVITITGLILLKTRLALNIVAIALSFLLSLIIAGNWISILGFFQPTSFNYVDPQFNNDISFYIFILPVLNLVSLWLNGLLGCGLIIIFLRYLLSGNSLTEGKFPGFSAFQIRHLSLLSGMVMIAMALYHWLNRYQLLYSQQGVVYGAGFTDVKFKLPIETILCISAIAIAFWLFYYSLDKKKKSQLNKFFKLKIERPQKAKIIIVLLPVLFYLFFLLTGEVASKLVQRFRVQPNELAAETPYLLRNIAMTRRAFNLDEIVAETFNPQGELTATDIASNSSTIENIRLWDTRPILQTNRQLQLIRLYYQFLDADVDRYLFENDKQQVIISARELDYESVPQRAKTWVNKHLVYTHGYGFTLSPVNQVSEGGLPFYYVKDIGTSTTETGGLTVSSQVIRDSIPLENPRIYYGEITDNYVMTNTKVREFDFPSGEENIYNIYDGTGGIGINNYGLRLIFAEYLKDWQMLFTRNFTPETKVLLRRDIAQRVTKIAPWLRYDNDPYLVVANPPTQEGQKESNLYWIIDAYTISDRHPYSDPGTNSFNYIRNSVKVVVDAYNGDIDFYIADPDDPIINTWNKVFSRLFKPLAQMPVSLQNHIRYPEDLFSTQSEQLLVYHMTDAQVFYNREDQWQIPQEIYGNESQSVEPYYLIMRLPTASEEEFILLHPYTPVSRPNLIAWLAARSDGDNYGKLLLYKFPKQRLVYGPKQIEALINQDPVISQQISLWNREGSRAIQGNLLIIPIEQSLLYVEPLYIEAEQNSLPTLVRVIVVYENQIVMAETLDEAISAIFQPEAIDDSTIIRPVEAVE